MKDSSERYEELVKYFDDYASGKFDEDDQILDELSLEVSELQKELGLEI